jgi:signal transduction histidine kinase
VVAIAGLLLAITALIAVDGEGPASAFRHLYLIPTLWAAHRAGAAGGALAGFVAGLLYAPLVLPAIERVGLDARAIDGLVALGMPLGWGVAVGGLVDQPRGQARRLAALLAVQRELTPAAMAEGRLGAVAELVRAATGAEAAAIIVRDDDGRVLVGAVPEGVRLDPRSAAAWVLQSGSGVAVQDLAVDPRFGEREVRETSPRRGLVIPLRAGTGSVGVLALEWCRDVAAATRAAAEEMSLHVALGVEKARLALRQRRFAQELETQVAAATGRLRDMDRAKSEFLSVVSHELRTPLTALQGFSELLLRRAVPPDRAHRFLGHLHTEARRLGRIVTDLLDLSRIEAGRLQDLRPEPVDLAELAGRNLELFAAEHDRHRFALRMPDGRPVALADPDALDRVLKNLLSNAVKYSPRGGLITLMVGRADGCPGMVEVIVEDEGVGIPAESLPRIFDRYVRLAHPETGATRGLGVGLSVVRSLVEAHGGRVEVESWVGRGSRFRVLLPSA